MSDKKKETANYSERQEAYRLMMLANQPTLADQFAMAALTGLTANPSNNLSNEATAKACFEISRVMMACRDLIDNDN